MAAERSRVASFVADAIHALVGALDDPATLIAPLHAYGKEPEIDIIHNTY